MHLDFYRLRENPFSPAAGLLFPFLSSGQRKAFSVVSEGIKGRKGLMAVLGEYGLGKTTLIRALIQEWARQNVKMIPLWDSRISFEEILQVLCRGLGLPVDPGGPSRLSIRLSRGLGEACQAGLNVVLLVDEAHEMSAETLESLRLVANQEMALQKTLQVVFFGLPAFWENLGRHELRQLKQRIGVITTLSPLTLTEGRESIRSRIARAGGKVADVFTPRAVDEIIRQAGGNPLRMNILGRKALIRGCESARKPVTEKIVKAVIGEPPLSKGTHYWPWVASSAAVLLIALGGVAVSRIADSSPPGEYRSRLQKMIQGQSANRVSGKIIVEEDFLPDRKNPPARKVRVVKEGDNFFRLVLEVYGFSNPALWDFVQKYNPRIKDVTRIPVGEKIVFPEWEEGAQQEKGVS